MADMTNYLNDKAEEWARKKALIEEERKRKKEEEERKKREEEERKKREEEERARKAEEERKRKEAEAKLKEEERKKLEEERKKKSEEQFRKNAEEAEKARKEEEAQHEQKKKELQSQIDKQRADNRAKANVSNKLYHDDNGRYSAKDIYKNYKVQQNAWNNTLDRYKAEARGKIKPEVVANKAAGSNEYVPTQGNENNPLIADLNNAEDKPYISDDRILSARNTNVKSNQEQREAEIANSVTATNDVQNQNNNQSQLDKWLSPDYKLSNEEKEEAKQLINNYENFAEQHKGTELTPEQKEYEQSIYNLKTKLSGFESLAQGVISAIPFLKNWQRFTEENAQNAENENAALEGREAQDVNRFGAIAAQQNAKKQNPGAYWAGNIGTTIGTNLAAQNALGATQYGAKLAEGVNGLIGEGPVRNVLGNILTDTLMDMPVDTALDTIPQLALDIYGGKSKEEIAQNLSESVGGNLLGNLAGAGIGNIGDIAGLVKGLFKRSGKEITDEVAEQVAKQIVEESAEGATKQADNIIPNVNNVNNVNANANVVNNVPPMSRIAEEEAIRNQTANDFDLMNQLMGREASFAEEQAANTDYKDILANAIEENGGIPRNALPTPPTPPTNSVDDIVDSTANAGRNVDNFTKTIEEMEEAREIPRLNGGIEADTTINPNATGRIVSKEDIKARDINKPIDADEMRYFADNDSAVKSIDVKIGKKNAGQRITSTIDTYLPSGKGSKPYNQAHNAFEYANEYLKTGNRAYLDRASEIIDDIDNGLVGTTSKRGTEYQKGWLSEKWANIVDNIEEKRLTNSFTDNASDVAKNSKANLDNLGFDTERYVKSVEQALNEPTVDSFGRVQREYNDIVSKVRTIVTDEAEATQIKSDVDNIYRDFLDRYNVSKSTPSASTVTNTVENTVEEATQQAEKEIPSLYNAESSSDVVNRIAQEGNPSSQPLTSQSASPYKTANADVDTDYMDDFDGFGASSKATFDNYGMKSETLPDGTEMKRSKTFDNTLMNQRGTSQAEKEALDPQNYMYAVNKRANSVNMARESVNNNLDGMERTYFSDNATKAAKQATAEDADNLFAMQYKYLDMQREAKANGDIAQVDVLQGKIDQVTKRIQEYGTKSAQFLRAMFDYSHNADGAINAAKAISDRQYMKIADNSRVAKAGDEAVSRLKNIISDYVAEHNGNISAYEISQLMKQVSGSKAIHSKIFKNNIANMDLSSIANQMESAIKNGENLDDIYESFRKAGIIGTPGISQRTIEEVTRIFDNVKDLSYDSKDYMKAEGRAYALLANDLNMTGSFADKVNTWRYFSMLANLKTHIRNIGGNGLFGLTTTIKDTVAGAIEGVADTLSKDGIDRTTTWDINPLRQSDRNLLRATREDAENIARRLTDGNKYKSAEEGIFDSVSTYKNETLNKITDINTKALDAEDTLFLNLRYSDSLARYLKANGVDASVLKSADPQAMEFAVVPFAVVPSVSAQ